MAGKVQDKLTAPLLYALPVPTFVPDKPVTGSGCRKLSCAEDLIPLFLLDAILLSFNLLSYYADRSPITTHVSVALLNRVAEDH